MNRNVLVASVVVLFVALVIGLLIILEEPSEGSKGADATPTPAVRAQAGTAVR